MKKLNFIKGILSLLTIVSVLELNQIKASAEWQIEGSRNTQKIWYKEGNSWATGWRYIDNNWYYFDPDTGCTVYGWKYINGNWYYFEPSRTGDSRKPCFMASSTLIQDRFYTTKYYYLNSDGVYIDNPPQEVSAYMALLKDDEKLNKLGILTPARHKYYLDNGTPQYISDKITQIYIDDTNKDGILEMKLKSMYISGMSLVEYNNGNIVSKHVNSIINSDNASANNQQKTTTKNIVEQSGL